MSIGIDKNDRTRFQRFSRKSRPSLLFISLDTYMVQNFLFLSHDEHSFLIIFEKTIPQQDINSSEKQSYDCLLD